MADFTGKNICSTFKSILNLGGASTQNCVLNGNTACIVTDGTGQQSSLYLRTKGNGMISCGTLQVRGGTLNMCGNSINNANQVNATGVASSGLISTQNSLDAQVDVLARQDLRACRNLAVAGVATITGVIRGCSDIIAFYSSDKRLKENVNKIVNSKEVVNNLTGYSFDWKEEADREGKDFGVMAQDVEKVLPELVHERPDGFKSVDYVKIIPYLIEEVKRLDAEVEELKSIQTF